MSADAFTVAQNSNAVSHRKNFLKTVRNVDDADSLGAQVPDDAEEEFDLFCRQRCSRFVHDEDAGAAAKGTGDFDQLLLGHRKPADFGVGIDISAHTLQKFAGLLT